MPMEFLYGLLIRSLNSFTSHRAPPKFENISSTTFLHAINMSIILSNIQQIPSVVVEFENQIYKGEDISSCLAIQAVDKSDAAISGSNMQTGHLWEHDVESERRVRSSYARIHRDGRIR